jgi:hypothetical protein
MIQSEHINTQVHGIDRLTATRQLLSDCKYFEEEKGVYIPFWFLNPICYFSIRKSFYPVVSSKVQGY